MNESSSLPCPLCGISLDIRKSVKGKPYTVCDRCGLQMFIRKETGVSALKRLLEGLDVPINPEVEELREKVHSLEMDLHQEKESTSKAKKELKVLEGNVSQLATNLRNAKNELTELKKFTHRTCPECNEEFQIREDLIATSWFDGEFRGYRCPNANCGGIVSSQEKT